MTDKVNKAGDAIRDAKAAKTFMSRKDSLLDDLKMAKKEYWDTVGGEWPADVETREKKKKGK